MMVKSIGRILLLLPIFAVFDGAVADSLAVAGAMEGLLTQDFRSAQLDVTRWSFVGPAEYSKPDEEGVFVEIPENAGAVPSAGIGARFGLHGDFELTAELELLDVPQPKEGYGAGATLAIAAVDGQGASLQRVRLPKKGDSYVCHRAVPQADGKVNHAVHIVPATAPAGRISLIRDGAKLRYLAIETSTAEPQLLHEAHFTKADVRMIHLAAQSGEAPNAVKIRWKEFQARAETLLEERSKAQNDAKLIVWSALVLAGTTTAAMLWLKAKARRSSPNSVPR